MNRARLCGWGIILLVVTVSAVATTNTVFTDLDGDGDLDVFLEVLLENNGGGTFVLKNASDGIGNIANITQGYFVNVDGDGDEDLYIRRDGFQNFLYRNNGDETFTNISGTSLGINLTGSPTDPSGTVFADFDSDGDVDAFVRGVFFASVASFADVNGTNVSNLDEIGNLSEVIAVDLNKDSLLDLVGVNASGGLVVFLNRNDSNGDGVPEFYEATRDVQLHTRTEVNNVAAGDIKTGITVNESQNFFPFADETPPFIVDAFNDLYLARSSANELFIQLFPQPRLPFRLLNQSGFYIPRFIEESTAPINDSGNSSSAIIADFDNNNLSDILVGNRAAAMQLFLRNESTWFTRFVSVNLSNISNNTKMVQAADLDGDSDLDIAGIGSIILASFEGDGTTTDQVTDDETSPGEEVASVESRFNDLLGVLPVGISFFENAMKKLIVEDGDGFDITISANAGHTTAEAGSTKATEFTITEESSSTSSTGGLGGGSATNAYNAICPHYCSEYPSGDEIVPPECKTNACGWIAQSKVPAQESPTTPPPTQYSITEQIITDEQDANAAINVIEAYYVNTENMYIPRIETNLKVKPRELSIGKKTVYFNPEAFKNLVEDPPVLANTQKAREDAARRGVEIVFDPARDQIQYVEPPVTIQLYFITEKKVTGPFTPSEEFWFEDRQPRRGYAEVGYEPGDPTIHVNPPPTGETEKDCEQRIAELRASIPQGTSAPAEVWQFLEAFEQYLNEREMSNDLFEQLNDESFMDGVEATLGGDVREELENIKEECVKYIVTIAYTAPPDTGRDEPVGAVNNEGDTSRETIPVAASNGHTNRPRQPAPQQDTDEEQFRSFGAGQEHGYEGIQNGY